MRSPHQYIRGCKRLREFYEHLDHDSKGKRIKRRGKQRMKTILMDVPRKYIESNREAAVLDRTGRGMQIIQEGDYFRCHWIPKPIARRFGVTEIRSALFPTVPDAVRAVYDERQRQLNKYLKAQQMELETAE